GYSGSTILEIGDARCAMARQCMRNTRTENSRNSERGSKNPRKLGTEYGDHPTALRKADINWRAVFSHGQEALSWRPSFARRSRSAVLSVAQRRNMPVTESVLSGTM